MVSCHTGTGQGGGAGPVTEVVRQLGDRSVKVWGGRHRKGRGVHNSNNIEDRRFDGASNGIRLLS